MAALPHSKPKTTANYSEHLRRDPLAEAAIKRIHDGQCAQNVPLSKQRDTPLAKKPIKTTVNSTNLSVRINKIKLLQLKTYFQIKFNFIIILVSTCDLRQHNCK